jgi:hypothetical protein
MPCSENIDSLSCELERMLYRGEDYPANIRQCIPQYRFTVTTQVQRFRVQEKRVMETYRRLKNLIVYQKICRLNIEIGTPPVCPEPRTLEPSHEFL